MITPDPESRAMDCISSRPTHPRATRALPVVPTSESSWIIVTAGHDRLIGFICAEDDSSYTAHDEHERLLGRYSTFSDALVALGREGE